MTPEITAKLAEYQKVLSKEYAVYMQSNEQIRNLLQVNEQRFKSILELTQRMGQLFGGDINHIVPPGGAMPPGVSPGGIAPAGNHQLQNVRPDGQGGLIADVPSGLAVQIQKPSAEDIAAAANRIEADAPTGVLAAIVAAGRTSDEPVAEVQAEAPPAAKPPLPWETHPETSNQ